MFPTRLFLLTGLSACAALIASAPTLAQDTPEQQEPPAASQSAPSEDWNWGQWRERMREWGPGMMWGDDDRGRGPGMMGPGTMGWGGGMPMHSRMMPVMMMAMMDADDSGTLSFAEIEAVHRRMFDFLDANGDGELSPDEIRAMMTGDER